MRALVIGVDGGIGAALATALAAVGWEVAGTSRRPGARIPLDLEALPDRLDLPRADACFLCAAMTRQADCRVQPDRSRRINVEAPARIAEAVVRTGGYVVLLSSNAVFDGSLPCRAADNPPCPANTYGRQKADAEAAVLALPDTAVLRLTKVLTPALPLFRGWIDGLRAGRPVDAFADMVLAPVALPDATAALMTMAAARAPGIFQASAVADIAYADAARHLARRLGVTQALVHEVRAEVAGIPAAERPAATSLDAGRLAGLTGRPVPDAFAAIDRTYGFG